MPTVTVLAPDSALAMDEVIRQLGDNAYILSTHARDGQIEILATNEPIQIPQPRKRTTSVSFADVMSEHAMQAPGTPPSFKTSRVVPETAPAAPVQTATIVNMQTARARLSEAAPAARPDTPRHDSPQDTVAAIAAPPRLDDGAAAAPRIYQDGGPALALSADLRERAPHDPWVPVIPNQDATSVQAAIAEQPLPHPAEADLGPILADLAAQLARLQAALLPQARAEVRQEQPDPLLAGGFSAEIITRLAPDRDAPGRAAQFAAALSKALVCPDPMASLRAPVVVVVGPSGAGKTILAGKIAALMLEVDPNRAVELVSLCQTPRFANTALPIYARMLSVPHRNLQSDPRDAAQWAEQGKTSIIDTNLETEALQDMLGELRSTLGDDLTVIVALPLGSSLGKIKSELGKFAAFDPVVALTKLDECELSPQEASQIAETGTQIAWLSGTRALTETMAPAAEEMMTEFLTGLLAARS
jgi:flagellar biosynthesis GTPase FlhF